MFETPAGPRVVQATSLALSLMRMTKKPWQQTITDMPTDVVLSDDQIALLTEWELVLNHVAPSVAEGVESTTTVYCCTQCGRWGYIGSGSPPKTCNLDMTCSGEVVKAGPVAKANGK